MGLFSSLTETSSTSSLTIPTTVQLYKDSPVVFGAREIPRFEQLSYQTTPLREEEEEQGLRKKQQLPPELGVWNCKIASSLSDRLLLQLPRGVPLVWTVDLEHSADVEPTLTALQQATVRILIQETPPASTETTTTSLAQLETVSFGAAPQDTKAVAPKAPPEEHERQQIALVIAAKRATASDDYQNQQTQAFLLYHLRRYAAALGATLCLIQDEPPLEEQDPETAVATLTTLQLGIVLRDLANGVVVWNEIPADLGMETAPFYYGDDPLIETALLRLATYPGHWDANTDSVWKVLPASPKEQAPGSPNSVGDQGWLAELRNSVKAESTTPSRTTTPPPAAKKKDADVSNFFESLLKK